MLPQRTSVAPHSKSRFISLRWCAGCDFNNYFQSLLRWRPAHRSFTRRILRRAWQVWSLLPQSNDFRHCSLPDMHGPRGLSNNHRKLYSLRDGNGAAIRPVPNEPDRTAPAAAVRAATERYGDLRNTVIEDLCNTWSSHPTVSCVCIFGPLTLPCMAVLSSRVDSSEDGPTKSHHLPLRVLSWTRHACSKGG